MFSEEDRKAISKLKSFLLEKTVSQYSSEDTIAINSYKEYILSESLKESIPDVIEIPSKTVEIEPTIIYQERIIEVPTVSEEIKVPTLLEVVDSLKSDSEFVSKVKGESVQLKEILEALVNNEDFISAVKGKDGIDGEDSKSVSIEDIISSLKKDKDFLEKVKGEPGKGPDHSPTYWNPGGGGLGENDVRRLIDIYGGGGGGSFTGTIAADKVTIDTTTFVATSGSDVNDVLKQMDTLITQTVIFGDYETNDVLEETNGDLYVGLERPDGKWYFKQVIDTLGDLTIRHANISNNPTITTYLEAFTNYLILSYDLLEDLTF